MGQKESVCKQVGVGEDECGESVWDAVCVKFILLYTCLKYNIVSTVINIASKTRIDINYRSRIDVNH